MKPLLLEKRALITGAASGIGRATAKLFASEGADLILVDNNKYELQETKEEINKSQVENKDFHIETYSFDLSKKTQVDRFWNELENLPDILVNNAGIYPFQNFLKMDEDTYQHILDVNLSSMVWMCQNFIRRKKKDGVVVNVSSIEAVVSFKKDMVPYSISKAGVIALTDSIAKEFGKKGFRANVVMPGAIRTEGTGNLIKKTIKTLDLSLAKIGYDFNQRLTLGRWGKPEEVANMILALSSNFASYVNGSVYRVDGGFLSA